jgi:hypothetical protein
LKERAVRKRSVRPFSAAGVLALVLAASAAAWGQDTPGIYGEYYNDRYLTTRTGIRIDTVPVYYSSADTFADNEWKVPNYPQGVGITGENNFSIRWRGELLITTAGSYTLTIASDDGSRLYMVNPSTGVSELLVDMWRDQGRTEGAATRTLPAGRHPFMIEYYENSGDATMEFLYSGPDTGGTRVVVPITNDVGTTKVFCPAVLAAPTIATNGGTELLPDGNDIQITPPANPPTGYTIWYTVDGSDPGLLGPMGTAVQYTAPFALNQRCTIRARMYAPGYLSSDIASQFVSPRYAAVTQPVPSSQGVYYRYYYNTWGGNLPNFDPLIPAKRGLAVTANSWDENNSLLARDVTEYYGFQFTGYVYVGQDGMWTFYTSSDDGSALYIHDGTSWVYIVNNDGSHGTQERSGKIGLAAGWHPIKVLFSQGGGGDDLQVRYEGPGTAKALIPSTALCTETPVATPTFTPATGGYFTGSQVVTINAVAGATIYYTTDGTYPSSNSANGGGPSGISITLTDTSTIRAVAYVPGSSNPSEIAVITFTRTDVSPDLLSVTASAPASAPGTWATKVKVIFNTPVVGTEAVTAANYGITDRFGANPLPVSTAVLESPLRGNWKFDAVPGSVVDSSGNAYDLTLFNGAVTQAVVPPSLPGSTHSLYLDGTDDYAATANAGLNTGLGSFTVSFWMRLDAGVTDARRVVNKWLSGTDLGWLIDVNSDAGGGNSTGSLRFRMDDDVNNFQTYVTAGLAQNTWYHVVARVDRQSHRFRFYVNGAAVGTEQSTASVVRVLDNNTVLGIGTIPSTAGKYFKGNIDDVRLYSIALTDAEISALYAGTAPASSDIVTLTTSSAMTASGLYRLTVVNVKDRFDRAIPAPGARMDFKYYQEKSVWAEYYTGFGGTNVVDLTHNIKYPNDSDSTLGGQTPVFERPGIGDNYGSRLRGYFYPASASLTFGIAGDDSCRLEVGTGESPYSLRQVAWVNGWTNWREYTNGSAGRIGPVTLDTTRRYFIQSYQKEGGGGDHVAVTATSGTIQNNDPALGNVANAAGAISPYVEPMKILRHPVDRVVQEGQSVTFTVAAVGSPQRQCRWYKDGDLIAGANQMSYAIPVVSAADAGDYYVEIQNDVNTVISNVAVLIVCDTTRPTLALVVTDADPRQVYVTFDERVEKNSAENPANYTITSPPYVESVLVASAVLQSDGKTVLLILDQTLNPPFRRSFCLGDTYTLSVSGVNDRSLPANTILPGSTYLFTPAGMPVANLTGYWRLDETGAARNALDSAGGDNNGTLLGSNLSWVAGQHARALNFGGVDGYVSSIIPVPTKDITLSLWFRTSSLDPGGLFSVVDGVPGDQFTTSDRAILFRSGNLVSEIFSTTGFYGRLYSGTGYNDGGWHNVVFVVGGIQKGSKMFVDGVLKDSQSYKESGFDWNTGIAIGWAYNDSGGASFFDGDIDDVRVYDRALSTAEITSLSNTNMAPVANAGSDLSALVNTARPLQGSVPDDDGRPAAAQTMWTAVSGPGAVTFADATSLTTNATFTATGDYILRLTASDTVYRTCDFVNVHVVVGGTSPSVQFRQLNSSGPESTTAVDIEVTLDWPATGVVTVPFAVSGTATNGVDYSITETSPLSFAVGETSKIIHVTVVDDAADESPSETLVVTLGTPTGPAVLGTVNPHTYTIVDDDGPPTAEFEFAGSSGDENVPGATIRVVLNRPMLDQDGGYVNFSRIGGTATSGTDFDPTKAAGTCFFPQGSTYAEFTLTIYEDTLDEPNETIQLQLINPSGVIIGALDTHTYTIKDNDLTTVVNFASATSSVAENAGTAAVRVSLDQPAQDIYTIRYRITGGTALSGADYTMPSGEALLTFNPGDSYKDIIVTILDDTSDEGVPPTNDETVILELYDPWKLTVGGTSAHVLSIVDDDEVPGIYFQAATSVAAEPVTAQSPMVISIPVVLTSPSGNLVSVAYTLTAGTAEAGDFSDAGTGSLVFQPGQAVQYVQVAVYEDADPDADTVTIALINPANATVSSPGSNTLTILDKDGTVTVEFGSPSSSGDEGVANVSIPVTLSAATGNTITVPFTVGGTAAGGGVDYTMVTTGDLTFAPGQTTANIQITVVDDAILENPNETILLTLGTPASSPNAGGVSPGAQLTHTYTILNNEPVPMITITDIQVVEGVAGGLARFTVTLSAASATDVTVDYATADGTGPTAATVADGDYTSTANTLTIPAGATTGYIDVPIGNDTTSEPNETFTIALSNATSPWVIFGSPATCTIVNDDNSITVNDPTVGEADGDLVFTVSASTPIAAGLTINVNYAIANGTAVVVNDYDGTTDPLSGTLTFDSANPSRTVRVHVVADNTYEDNETVLLNLTNAQNAVIGDAQGTGTITDDDTMPEVDFDPASVTTGPESTVNPAISLRLSQVSGRETRVVVAPGAGTATLEADYTLFSPAVLAALRGYWKLDDATIGAAQAIDSAGLNAPGSHISMDASNRDTGSTAPTAFANASSLAFNLNDENNEYVDVPSFSWLVGGPVTVTFWVYVRSSGDTQDGSAFSVGGLDNPNRFQAHVPWGDGNLYWDYGDLNGNGRLRADFNGFRDKWTHVALVSQGVGGSFKAIYLDGAPVTPNGGSSTVSDGPRTSLNGLTLGRYGNNWFHGRLDDFRIYNSVLAPSVIASIASSTAPVEVVIPAGQQTATVPVTIVPDSLNEAAETVILNIQSATGATVTGTPQHTYTITDDDPEPTVAFVQDSSGVEEENTTVQLAVQLSEVSGRTVTVNYAATGGTAAGGGTDYTLVSGTLTFNPGEFQKFVPVTIAEDTLNENSETVVVALSAPGFASLGTRSTHTLTITDDDPVPTLTFRAPVTSSAPEGNSGTTVITLTVDLSTVSGRDVLVDYGVGGGTATLGTDFTLGGTGTLTIPAGATSGTIDLNILGDTRDEDDETVSVILTNLRGADPGADLAYTHTIENDADTPPTVSFVPATAGGAEETAVVVVGVELSGPSDRTVTVEYGLTGGTASNGVDFALTGTGALVFAPGETSKTIVLDIFDDLLDEDNETVILGLSNLVNCTAGTVAYTYTINDDADPPPAVSFALSGSQGQESVTAASLSVNLSSASGRQVQVAYTVGGTATGGGVDYTLANGTLTFLAGETSKIIPLAVVNDSIDEDNETVVVTLTNPPTNATMGANAAHTYTILDNDTAGFVVTPTSGLVTTEAGGTAQFTVRLATQPTADVTIGISSLDTTEGTVAPASLTFTGVNWATPQPVTVTGVDADVPPNQADGNVAYTVATAADAATADLKYRNLNPPDVSVTNMDANTRGIAVSPTAGLVTTEAGGTATFTVVLTSAPDADVTIALSSSDTTEGTVSPASLTFTVAAGANSWDTPHVVTVTGVGDFVDDGDIAYTIVTAPAAGGNYAGLNAADVSVTNTDDDTAGITVSAISGTTAEAAGPGNTATFTVALNSQPTANVTLTVTSSDTTEGLVSVTGSTTPAASKTLTFTAATWNAVQTVTVHGQDDRLDDGDVAYVVVTSAASSADPRYSGLNPADVAVTNIDNDDMGVTVTAISGNTTEAGGQATFTIVLASQPLANVTFSLSVDDPTEGSVSPALVTFTASNWNVVRTVTVTGVNDLVDDGDVVYHVVISPAVSTDPLYSGVDPADVAVTNVDNDTAAIVVSPTAGLTTTEAGGTASFSVRLASQPTSNVSISLSSTVPGEGVPSPSVLTFTAANWSANQTVTVTGVDDFVDDGNQAYSISVGPAASADNYNGLSGASVALTNTDNDSVGITVSPTSGLVTGESGGQATFTVVLRTQPVGTVTVTLASNDNSEGVVSPTQMTFNAGNWNIPQISTVTGLDDSLQDGSVAYTIVTAVDATVAGRDPAYDAVNPADVSVVNADDDSAGITVAPTAGLTTTEAAGPGHTATFQVVLNTLPTASVTITLTSSDTTEGTVSPASLTFTTGNWSVPQPVTVTGADDSLDDGDVVYTIRTNPASSTDPNYNGRNAADVAVTSIDDDTAGITVSAISGTTAEAGPGTATFTVVLDSQPASTVSINVSTSDASEGLVSIAGSPTPAASKVLTFSTSNWATAQTVTVTGVNDDVDDGDAAYTVVLAPAASSDPRYSGMDAADVAVTNVDDDTAGITVSAISGNTTEAGGTATFTVVLNSTPAADVVINLSTSNPAEGWVSPSTLTFTPADARTPRTVTVTGVDDTVDDDNAAYSIITSAAASGDPLYHGVDPADVAVTNVDNDTAGISVFPTTGLTTTEAGGQATFTVVLASTPLTDVTIAVSVSDATEGSVSPALLTFTPATAFTAQTVTVTGVNDDVDDGNAACTVVLSPAVSADPKYAGRDPADVAVTNVDDDTAGIAVSPTSGLMTTESGAQAAFTVALSSQPTDTVTIGLSSSDTNEGTVAPPSLVFTPLDWNLPQTVTVTGVDDGAVVDGNKLYTILTAAAVSADLTYNGRNAADVTVTNVDNDVKGIAVSPTTGLVTTEAGGTASFSVVLSSQPTAGVTISLASSDTTEGTVVPASLTFTDVNWNVPQTVTVTGAGDSVDDGDIAYTIVTGQATSGDTVYNGLAVADVSVTNLDDDTAGITVTPTAGLITTEAGGTAQFSVVLNSQPTANVSVTVTTSDGTEGLVSTAASPTFAVSKTLVFTAATWNMPQDVTVRGAADLLDDGDVAYAIVTSPALSSDPKYSGLNPADVSATNVDDDDAGITVSGISGDTTEAGGTATFTVALASQPTASVTVGLLSSDPTEGTVSPASITFSTTNWNLPRTVTVTGVNDSVDDGDVAYTVILEPAVSTDPQYNGRDAADVAVTNLDNDARGLVVSPTAGLTTTEAGGTATFTVKLSSQPLADVVIPLTSSNPAEGVPSPASLTFTAANWNVTQTVTLRGVDDFVDDGTIAYTVAVGPATSTDPLYLGQSGTTVAATNADNDTVGITVAPTSGLVTSEAGGTALFTVVLRTQPAGTGTVTVNMVSSDPTEGTVSPAQLVFGAANWNVPQGVTVSGVDDAAQDGSVAYAVATSVDASDPGRDAAYDAVNPADVSVTNADNDTAGITVAPTAGLTVTEAGGQATFLVVLNTLPTADVTIGLATSDATEGTVSPASLTFTAANWNAAQTVTVTGASDDLDDGDVVFSIRTNAAVSADPNYSGRNAADVQATCLDDDSAGIVVSGISGDTTEAGGTATFTVRLAAAPASTVSIALSSSDTTEGTVSPSGLYFTAANWSTPQTVTVTGRDDFSNDGDVAYAVVLAAAVSTDPAFNGLDADDVAVVNLDNDAAGFTVTPTAGLVTTEAGGTASFTVALNTVPAADVTIAVSVSNPAEGSVTPTVLTFTPANARNAQRVTVQGVNDLVDDGDASYTVILGAAASADPDYSGLDPVDVSVTNTDNDAASITVSPTANLTTTEAGGSATFTVVLGTQPAADVTIALSSSDPTEGSVSPAVLVFSSSNWNLPRTVTVTGVDDVLDDGNVAYAVVTAPASSADLAYAGRDAANVSVTNADNDTAGITVSPTSGLVTTESGGQASFTIVLHTEPTADVTIGLSSSDPTEGTVAPASVTFTPLNWNVPQTVVATGIDGDTPANSADGSVLYRIVTAAAVSTDAAYNGRDPADVTVTNTDNDAPGITVSPVSGLVTTEAGGQATFTVCLNSAPGADVTITLATSDATEGAVSPASLTFTSADYNIAQTVTVTGVNDDLDDGDVVYTIRTNPASSTDAQYRYLNAADVSVTNVDNDTAGITVTPLTGNTNEGGGTAWFAVVLDSQPASTVSIAVSSSDPSEGLISTVASPIPAASRNVVFSTANWATPQVVTVTGQDDLYDDGDVAYTIVLAASTSADPKYAGLNPEDFSLVNADDDTAGITVSAISGDTTEAGGTATFTVVLATRPAFDVTVGLSSSDPSEGTVSASFLTFTSANWNSVQTVTVRGVNDSVDDGNVAYAIVTAPASSADPAYNGLDPNDVAVTNVDNDTAGISVSTISGNTTEAGGKATFTIKLNSQPTADVTIPLSSSDTTEGTVSPLAVTFTALNWNVLQTVTVTGVDDFEDDGNVAYTIVTGAAQSADAVYAAIAAADVAVTNVDNDTAGITVVPTTGLYTTESGGQATFTVVLNSQPTAPVTIGIASSDPARGTVSPASVAFTGLNWNVPQTVTVTGVDDGAVADGSHGYTVQTAPAASADGAYQDLDAADVAVVNTDNDTPGITVTPTAGLVTTEAGGQASFTIVLNTQPAANVTIGISSSDATEGSVSAASAVFTPQTWSTPQTITVTGVDDAQADGDIPFTILTAAATSTDTDYSGLNAADISVTNRDDDTAGITVIPTSGLVTTEAGGTASFTVVLDAQPSANVTIPVSSSDTAEGTVSPASLVFTNANWSTAQTVTVTGVNDSVQDGAAAYQAVLGAATSADPGYGGLNPPDVSVTNLDNDAAGINVSAISGNTTEAGGTATFTVVLASQPAASVTVAFSSSDTGEGTVTPSITFTTGNWSTAQTVTVTGVDDAIADGNAAYTIFTGPASSADPLYDGLDPADVPVVNTDNDTPGIAVVPTTGLVTSEAGAQDTFSVVLSTAPAADVTIALASSDLSEGTVSPSTLLFTPDNWNTAQTVTVTGVNDSLIDGNVPYTVVLSPAVSADPNYGGRDAADVAVTNNDNDAAAVVVHPVNGLLTTEQGGTASFTVVLNAAPVADVTIPISSSDTTEGTVSTDLLTFTVLNWDTAQAVTVTGVNDALVDGNQTYTIVTGDPASSDPVFNALTATSVDDVTVVNIDDETPGITVSAISGHTAETGTTAYFQVVLSTVPTGDVTLPITAWDATEGSVSPATLTFTPGDALVAQVVTVTGVDDSDVDGDITYTVTTGASTSTDTDYNNINPADVTVTNDDDEEGGVVVTPTAGLVTTEAGGTATFTMVLNAAPTASVTVNLSSSDTTEGTVSPASVTFTTANWNVPQTVTVTGVDDAVTDGDILYTIVTSNTVSADPVFSNQPVSDVSVTNQDNDVPGFTVTASPGLTTTEAGGTATFTVRLNTLPAASVTLPLSSSNTAEGTVSPATLTFTTANWNVAQTVTVRGVDDTIDDGNAAYTIVTGDPTSADPVYDALTEGQVADVSVTNTDNDTAVVAGIQPNRGPIAGGQTVTISGTTLLGATSVVFGSISVPAASFVSNSATEIVLLTPAQGAGGAVTVTVNFPGGAPTTTYTYVDPAATADLSVIKTANPPAPTLGENVEFSVVVSNSGQQPASGVVVTDLLPAGLTYVTHTASQGTYTRSTGLWTVGALAALNGSATLSVIARLDTAAPVTNTAEVTAMTSPAEGDLDSIVNNHDPAEDDQDSVSLSAALAIQTTSLPGGTVGAFYSQTLRATGGVTPYRWSIVSGALPDGLGLIAGNGILSGTATTAGTFAFTVQVTDSNSPQGSDTQALSITIVAAGSTPLAISNAPPAGIVGVPYDFTFTATGGTPPYDWSASGLPSGLALDMNTGRLSGIPTTAGSFSTSVTVTDLASATDTDTPTIVVSVNPVTITTLTLPDGSQGSAYGQSIEATGGILNATPWQWSVSSGAAPTGLTLSGTGRTATLSGTPTAAGVFSFTVQAEDSVGTTDTQAYTVTIATAGGPLAITPMALDPATVNRPWTAVQLTATGGATPYTGWTVTGGSLPLGMTLSGAGLLSGTPTESGTFGITVRVTDSSIPTAQTDAQDFSLTVNPAPAITTTSPLPSGTVGNGYFETLQAVGGTMPYAWTVTVGALPGGLSLDAATGVISGTPAAAGTTPFTVTLTDANGATTTLACSLTVVATTALAVVTNQLPVGEVGIPYSATLQAVGGTLPYTWSLAAGTLPSWATLDAATGTVSGTPDAAGTAAGLQFRATDAVAATANSAAMNLVVRSPLLITTAWLPNGMPGAAYSVTLATSGEVAPVQWTLVSGSLPGGLSLDPASGVISGQPSALGTSVFRVQASDAAGRTAQRQFTITVAVEAGGSTNSKECFMASAADRPAAEGGWTALGLAAVLVAAAFAVRPRRGFGRA